MSRRFKSSTFKFHQPLSGPGSKVVFECYGVHGKGYGGSPPFNTHIRVLCMNQETREVQWADGFYSAMDHFTSDFMRGKTEWVMLGWMMADGSLPLGKLDRVDPEMAQVRYLRLIDSRDTTWQQMP